MLLTCKFSRQLKNAHLPSLSLLLSPQSLLLSYLGALPLLLQDDGSLFLLFTPDQRESILKKDNCDDKENQGNADSASKEGSDGTFASH